MPGKNGNKKAIYILVESDKSVYAYVNQVPQKHASGSYSLPYQLANSSFGMALALLYITDATVPYILQYI